jgi:hypothetical protein
VAEIMPGPASQHAMYFAHLRGDLRAQRLGFAVEGSQVRGMFNEFRGHFFHGQYMVHQARCDRVDAESARGSASGCNHCMAHGTWDHA